MTAQTVDTVDKSTQERKQEKHVTVRINRNWKSAKNNTGENSVALDAMPTFQMQISGDAISIVPQSNGVRQNGKNPASVARRNARERRRIKNVNSAFDELRQHVPHGERNRKKISKVDTLQSAIEYIKALEELVRSRQNSAALFDGADNDKENVAENTFSAHSVYTDSENEENTDGFQKEQKVAKSQRTFEETNKMDDTSSDDLFYKSTSKRRCNDEANHDNYKRICKTKNGHIITAYKRNANENLSRDSAQHSDSGFSDTLQGSSEDELFSSFAPKSLEENKVLGVTQQINSILKETSSDLDLQNSLHPSSHQAPHINPDFTLDSRCEVEMLETITNYSSDFLPYGNILQTSPSENSDTTREPAEGSLRLSETWSNSIHDTRWSSVRAEAATKENHWPRDESYSTEFLGENMELVLPDIPQAAYVPISIDQINPSIDFLPEKADFSLNVTSFPSIQANQNLEQPTYIVHDATADLSLVLAQLN